MFFVIALTLVAGLFADTALAGKGDGQMKVTITRATPLVAASDTIPQVLQAKSTAVLTFTYTADDDEDGPINMNGGKVRLDPSRLIGSLV